MVTLEFTHLDTGKRIIVSGLTIGDAVTTGLTTYTPSGINETTHKEITYSLAIKGTGLYAGIYARTI